jgi:hypothetical protein
MDESWRIQCMQFRWNKELGSPVSRNAVCNSLSVSWLDTVA